MAVNGRDGAKIFDTSETAIKGTPRTDSLVSVKHTETNGDMKASSVVTIPQKIAFVYERFY